jgi:uncharacterized protein (DUF2235 family)
MSEPTRTLLSGRNLVICCDGTNNKFGPENTSVVRLIQVLDRTPQKQRLFYDPGVGTLPNPGAVTALTRRLSEYWELAFATDLLDKVGQAYNYLMESWKPGDRVFLFGFSRGAYTVRVLAGLLHTLGLLPRGGSNLIPHALRLFKSIRNSNRNDSRSRKVEYWKLCDAFRWTFARWIPESGDQRHFLVHFIGLWDTVSSVGWAWNPGGYPYTAQNPSVDTICHAVSLDERRACFRQNLIVTEPPQKGFETWFPGVHCDIGGGYPEAEGGLWRAPFRWVLDHATASGLLVNSSRLAKVLTKVTPSDRPWADRKHNSLTVQWWPAEFLPKLVYRRRLKFRLPRLNLFRRRYVPDGAVLHKSLLDRIRESGTSYSPRNLSAAFRTMVRNLPTISRDPTYRERP